MAGSLVNKCLIWLLISNAWGSVVEEEQRVLKRLFDEASYNPNERPSHSTVVAANMFVRNIESVDTKNMDFTVDITFRQQWTDPRLVHNSSHFLTLPSEDMVWRPDTFFRNEKEAAFHLVPDKQVYMRVFPTGKVLYSMRIKLKLHCGMDLRNFPFDSQTCQMQIASYSHSKETLEYLWKEKDPIQMTSTLHLPDMTLMKFKSAHCDVITSTGEYSCLSAEFVMDRESSFYILTVYVPFTMMLVLTWLVFWVKQKDSMLRIGMSLAILLWASAKTQFITESLSHVAYTKTVDIWTGCCILFIFTTLVVSVVVNWLGEDREESKGNINGMINVWKTASLSLQIDYVSRAFFPFMFVIFNMIYWAALETEKHICYDSDNGQCTCLYKCLYE